MENQNIINPITDQNNLQLNQTPIITTNKEKKLKILLLIFIALFLIALFTIFYCLNSLKKIKSEFQPEITNETSIIKMNPTATAIPTIKESAPTKTIDEEKTTIKLVVNDDPDIEVKIEKLSGNYATGGVTVLSTGYGAYHWWTVKIDGKWKIVWETQDSMACQIVEKYKIPKEMYDDCYSGYSQEVLDKYLNL